MAVRCLWVQEPNNLEHYQRSVDVDIPFDNRPYRHKDGVEHYPDKVESPTEVCYTWRRDLNNQIVGYPMSEAMSER